MNTSLSWIKAYDYKTGEEKKVYDQSGMFANQFVLTKDRVIAIGIDKVEQYDLCLLYTSCVPGIFQYVRKPYNDCAHHALDVFLYVQYSSWRRG